MLAVETTRLTKRFNKTLALDCLDLSLEQGEILGLVGPDGAGKTTAIKLLAALLRPTSGSARIFGSDTQNDAEEVRRRIGYMSQTFALYHELTVQENLDFFADLYQASGQEHQQRLAGLLEFSRLGPFRGRLAGRLSGGMKQKLGLSCALIHTPRLLLLDEPTTGVDPISRRELWRLLYEIWRQGTTIILATPYMDEAERCTRVAFMDRGRVVRSGRPEELKAGIGYSVFELTADDPRSALAVLQSCPGSCRAGLFGRRLHVSLDDPPRQLAQIEERLGAANIRLTGRRQIEPSLEDVYLSMLK